MRCPFGGFKGSGIGCEGVESSSLAPSESKIVAIKTRQSV
jgi:acyl-CoA reductase-like NAD-dependent aldehyde dehydrogenase